MDKVLKEIRLTCEADIQIWSAIHESDKYNQGEKTTRHFEDDSGRVYIAFHSKKDGTIRPEILSDVLFYLRAYSNSDRVSLVTCHPTLVKQKYPEIAHKILFESTHRIMSTEVYNRTNLTISVTFSEVPDDEK